MKEPEQGKLEGAKDGLKQVCKDDKGCPEEEITKNNTTKDIIWDMHERIIVMEQEIKAIKKHTETMNGELGKCKEELEIIKNKFFIKLSWKQVTAIITGFSGLVGLLANIDKIIKFFMGV